jgi:hypothetical protein
MALRPCDQIGPATPVDVLFEQLEVLVSHGTKHLNVECSECQRFLEVQDALMRPFQEKVPFWFKARIAKQKKGAASKGHT